MIDLEKVNLKKQVWLTAQELVVPLVEDHGLEETKSGGMLFVAPHTVTKVDQNIDAIQRVADWLLEDD